MKILESNLRKIISKEINTADNTDHENSFRALIKEEIKKNSDLNEGQLLTEIISFLMGIGALLLGLFGAAIKTSFGSFSESSFSNAKTAMTSWAKSQGYSEEDIKPGGKHSLEAGSIGLSSIVQGLAGILDDLKKLDGVDPLPPLKQEDVGDEDQAIKEYEEQIKSISESAGSAAGKLAGALKACATVMNAGKLVNAANDISEIKPTCAADVWHIAYASAFGIYSILLRSNKKGIEPVSVVEIQEIISWCIQYGKKFPDSQRPDLTNVRNTPSMYADPKLAEAAKEVIKGSIDIDEIKSWNGTIAHYLPALWIEVTDADIDEGQLKKLNDVSASGIDSLVDQLNSISAGSKIQAISMIGNQIIDEVFHSENGKFVNAKKHLDFMGRDTGHKYFFDPRYGDGWKNRVWGFALALPAEEVRRVALEEILPKAGVPSSLSLGTGHQGHYSKSDKTSWRGRTPSIELLMEKIKPIIQGSMWLAFQEGESGKKLSKSIGVITDGNRLTKDDIVRLFGENPETNGAFAPKETLDEPEKFWPGAVEKHLPGLKPDKSDFLKYILPHLMKKTNDLQLVPNSELWNFILAGDQSGFKEYGPGKYESLSGMVVESASRWIELAGLLKN